MNQQDIQLLAYAKLHSNFMSATRIIYSKDDRFKLHYQQIFLLLLACFIVFGDSCTTVPISLSGLNLCENNHCYYTQTATIQIPLFESSSSCLEFVSPDGLQPVTSLNFTVLHARHRWPLINGYSSDDPILDSKFDCDDHIFTSYTCSPSQIPVLHGFNVVCVSGVRHSRESFLDIVSNQAESYQLSIGFDARERFEVRKIKKEPKSDVEIMITNGNHTYGIAYEGQVQAYDHDPSKVNITVITDTSKLSLITDYVVWDKHSPTGFYLLDASDVNDVDEWSESKIGYIKVNRPTKLDPQIKNKIQVTVHKCHKKKWNSQLPFRSLIDKLVQRRSRLAHVLLPGTHLVDPKFNPSNLEISNDPQHSIIPYQAIKNGWMMINVDGTPAFFGLTFNNTLYPTPYVPDCMETNLTISTNQGVTVVGDDWICSAPQLISAYGENYMYSLVLVSNPSMTVYGACAKAIEQTDYICSNFTFEAFSWPEYAPAVFSFTTSFQHTLLPNHGDPEFADLSHLYTPIKEGTLEVRVDFKNLTVYFETTVVRPRINSITSDGNTINVNAQSSTVGGSCFIHTVPSDVLTTQPIELTVTPHDFNYTLQADKYKGDIEVGIQCYKNVASKSVTLDYDISVNQTDDITVGTNGTDDNDVPWHHTLHPGNWFSSIGEFFDGAWKDALGGVGKNIKWWHYLLMAVEIVVFIIAGVIFIWLFVKIWNFIPKPKMRIFKNRKSDIAAQFMKKKS